MNFYLNQNKIIMETKKISSNELEDLVKQIIKKEIEKDNSNQNINFLKTKESKDAKVYFEGKVMGNKIKKEVEII